MNLTEYPADSARPDETQSQRLHRLAMQDAQQQIAARYGERCRIESRTKEETRKLIQSTTERRLTKYVEYQEAIERNRLQPADITASDVNNVYPDWTARRYHGD
ncbi:hypothetical protein [Pantoea vagans]|uniref:hypothetical protein n=1 Tax=Pantoea vagans TaxID=470934 RepID=UPI0030163AB8